MRPGGAWLIAGGVASLIAAAVHLACIVGGGDWYRFFGAGEPIARAAERGSPVPALMTLAIAGVLAAWGSYALSGAGVIPRLPLLRIALIVITAIYLTRGAFLFFPDAFGRGDLSSTFIFWSSSIVLAMGIVHAVGLSIAWPRLGNAA